MKTRNYFKPGDRPDVAKIINGCASVRLVLLFERDADEAMSLVKTKDLPFAVKLAATEGLMEWADRARSGRKTWPRDRVVETFLRRVVREAEGVR